MQSKSLKSVMLLLLLSLLVFPFSALASGRGHAFAGSRPVVVQSYPYWAWNGWGDPFWGGYYSPYYYPADTRGKIKIKNFNEIDQVYLNGAYAGTVNDMKSIRLDPGRYQIQIRSQGRAVVDREVYVVSGKTVEIKGGETR